MFSKTFVQELAIKTNLPDEDVELILSKLHQTVKDTLLTGESVHLPGLGNLQIQHLSSLKEVDPASGKTMLYPPKDSLEFTPDN